jgi:RimJ/RimL family protein N-acetyltransferase
LAPSRPIPFPGGAIRAWRAADAKPLIPLADNRKVWINLTDRFPHPYTLGDARRWLKDASMEAPPRNHALECDGILCGGISLQMGDDLRTGTAEIGYWLGESYWGRGLATAAVAAFTAHAFATLGLRRVFARVLAWNPASARVLEKCGYVLEGRLRRSAIKDGKVADELLYARLPG